MDHLSSAFSKPILPSSSSLISPKPELIKPSFLPPYSSQLLPPPDPVSPPSHYRECLRNHAAGLGGHVIDGCGEFMPSGFADPLKCAACGCHRSFHRRDPPADSVVRGTTTADHYTTNDRIMINSAAAAGDHEDTTTATARCSSRRGGKKRFRTKFSDGQKEMMREFAERVGWRVMKKDEGEMEGFCAEVGVSRRVLKVWMHNNKHLSSSKKQDNNNHHHHVLHNFEEREVKVEGIMQQQYYE